MVICAYQFSARPVHQLLDSKPSIDHQVWSLVAPSTFDMSEVAEQASMPNRLETSLDVSSFC